MGVSDRGMGARAGSAGGVDPIPIPRPAQRIQGIRVYLRPLQESDLQERLAMSNDPQVQRRTIGDQVGVSRLADLQSWFRTLSADPHSQLWAVVTVAGVYLGDLDLHSIGLQPPNQPRHAWLNPFFGRTDYWTPEVEEEACRLLLTYARDVLKVDQVSVELLATDPLIPSLRRLGFAPTECLTGGVGNIDVLTFTIELRSGSALPSGKCPHLGGS